METARLASLGNQACQTALSIPSLRLEYKPFVVRNQQGRNRQGDNHSDNAEQGTPDRQAKEYGCRAHAHCIAHNFGR